MDLLYKEEIIRKIEEATKRQDATDRALIELFNAWKEVAERQVKFNSLVTDRLDQHSNLITANTNLIKLLIERMEAKK